MTIWNWLQLKTFWSSLEITTSPLPQRLTLPGSGLSWLCHIIPIFDLCGGQNILILLLIFRGFLLEDALIHPEGADIALLKLQVFKISAENGSLWPFFSGSKASLLQVEADTDIYTPICLPIPGEKMQKLCFWCFSVDNSPKFSVQQSACHNFLNLLRKGFKLSSYYPQFWYFSSLFKFFWHRHRLPRWHSGCGWMGFQSSIFSFTFKASLSYLVNNIQDQLTYCLTIILIIIIINDFCI